MNILALFFDETKPCPEQIINCDKLREEYKQDLEKINKSNCSACAITKLKSRYINTILNERIS